MLKDDKERTELETLSCDNCQFFIRHEYQNLDVISDYGQCRRYPPRRLSETMSAFPMVTDECWCGEHSDLM